MQTTHTIIQICKQSLCKFTNNPHTKNSDNPKGITNQPGVATPTTNHPQVTGLLLAAGGWVVCEQQVLRGA